MSLLAFAVRDAKAEAFVGSPIFVAARGLAVRSFADMVNNAETEFGKYPADFTLFEVGTYDPRNGLLEPRIGGSWISGMA